MIHSTESPISGKPFKDAGRIYYIGLTCSTTFLPTTNTAMSISDKENVKNELATSPGKCYQKTSANAKSHGKSVYLAEDSQGKRQIFQSLGNRQHHPAILRANRPMIRAPSIKVPRVKVPNIKAPSFKIPQVRKGSEISQKEVTNRDGYPRTTTPWVSDDNGKDPLAEDALETVSSISTIPTVSPQRDASIDKPSRVPAEPIDATGNGAVPHKRREVVEYVQVTPPSEETPGIGLRISDMKRPWCPEYYWNRYHNPEYIPSMNDKRVIGRLRDVLDDGDPFDAMDKLGWNAAYFFLMYVTRVCNH